ncbi:hypothetical protein FACS189487_09400 [Campylobacterota bacterium]|nr:hypothetical protein FACS189487_09400 [Campylobacterota bacterium]
MDCVKRFFSLDPFSVFYTPKAVVVLYYAGLLSVAFSSLGFIFVGLAAFGTSIVGAIVNILLGLLTLVLGAAVVRVVSEFTLLLFKIVTKHAE